MTPPSDEIIGTSEAARILNVDRSGVIKRVKAGELASQKLPGATGSHLFKRSDVEALLTPAAPVTGSPSGDGGVLSSPDGA